eukprot:scaffold13751_cov108-Isochrysis_galbana.AAC.12
MRRCRVVGGDPWCIIRLCKGFGFLASGSLAQKLKQIVFTSLTADARCAVRPRYYAACLSCALTLSVSARRCLMLGWRIGFWPRCALCRLWARGSVRPPAPCQIFVVSVIA